MIEAVTFDLWNTLFTNRNYTEVRVNFLFGALGENGISKSRDAIRKAYIYASEQAQTVWETENYRHMTSTEKLETILEIIDARLPKETNDEVIKGFEEAIWSDPPSLKKGVKRTLETLAPSYRMGIISDAGITPGRIAREVLRLRGILNYFESTVFSDETGVCKPHRSMFDTILRQLESKPSNAIHVGDLLHTDVAGAKKAGFKSVWLRTNDAELSGVVRPDYIIEEIPQIIDILEELKQGKANQY